MTTVLLYGCVLGAVVGVVLTGIAAYLFFCWFLWRCFGR